MYENSSSLFKGEKNVLHNGEETIIVIILKPDFITLLHNATFQSKSKLNHFLVELVLLDANLEQSL